MNAFAIGSTILWGLGFLAQWGAYMRGDPSVGTWDVALLGVLFLWGCSALVVGCG